MPTKSSDAFFIIDFRSQKKNSSNEFLHKTWFNKALFVYFENHFRKNGLSRKTHGRTHLPTENDGNGNYLFHWRYHFAFFTAIFYNFSAILYSNTSYLQLYSTNFQLNVTNIIRRRQHQQKFHLSNLLIKISLSVNLKTFYFMLWIRDGDQSVRLVFYLNYFVEKYIIYIFDFGHDKVIQNYMLTFR